MMAILVSSVLVVPINVEATSTKYYGDLKYSIISKTKKTCEIVGRLTGGSNNLKIPSKINGYKVIRIAQSAFEFDSYLVSVHIPSSVKTIEQCAFSDTKKLSKVTFEKGLQIIGNKVFLNSGIKKITLPNSVEKIGEMAFFNCSNLKSAYLPESVKNLGDNTFWCCTQLERITLLSEKVTRIPEMFAYECKSLKYVKLPNSIKTISKKAFSKCALTSINLPKNLESIGEMAFENCKLKNVTFPSKLTYIGESAFLESNLTGTLIIPGSVKTIDDFAFESCKNLKKLIFQEGVKTIGYNAFALCNNLTFVSFPRTLTECEGMSYYTNITIHGHEGSDVELNYGGKSNYKNHTYKKTIVEPSCGKGYTYYSCTCGYSYKDEYVDAIKSNHTVAKVKLQKATTTKVGYTEKTYCKVCNEVFKDSELIHKIGKVELSKTKFTYNGKTQKPVITVFDSEGNLIKSSYKITYPSKSKEVGDYTLKITFKDNYYGTIKKMYQITPKGTSVAKVTRVSNGVKLELKKQNSKTSGYQIQYAKNNNFSNAKTITLKKNTSFKRTIKKLSAGKKYYIRVRTYKDVKIGGKIKKIVSNWSKINNVIITKKLGKFYKQTEKAPSFIGISDIDIYESFMTYETQYSYADSNEISLKINNYCDGYYPYSVTFYRALSKNGKYKKLSPNSNDYGSRFNKYYQITDRKLASNKGYYYKVVVVFVPNNCTSKSDFKKLSATEKIYDETILPERFYTAPKPIRDLSTTGNVMRWKAVKGASGYLVEESAVKKMGYNIFGQPVFGHSDAEFLCKTNRANSRVKANQTWMNSASLFYDVYPYVKRGKYYYCAGEPVKKSISVSKFISYDKST